MTFHDTLHPLAAPARTHCAGPEAQDLGNDAQAGEKRAGAPGGKWRISGENGGIGGRPRREKNALDRPVCPVGAGVERRNARQRIMTDRYES